MKDFHNKNLKKLKKEVQDDNRWMKKSSHVHGMDQEVCYSEKDHPTKGYHLIQ